MVGKIHRHIKIYTTNKKWMPSEMPIEDHMVTKNCLENQETFSFSDFGQFLPTLGTNFHLFQFAVFMV